MALETLSAIGKMISLDTGIDPTVLQGSNEFWSCLSWCVNGWRKEDPPSKKNLSVEADVRKLLLEWGLMSVATLMATVVGDLILIAFYNFL